MLIKIKIQIKGITHPPVWRRILIPGQLNFMQFHQVIQAAFGWQDYHLFEFSSGGYGTQPQIGIIDEEWSDDSMEDANTILVKKHLHTKGQKFCYIYDFGDDWVHQITVEQVLDEVLASPMLIEGKGACPPEDCGGQWGYEEIKLILGDPKHPEHENTKEWLGLEATEDYDAGHFDLEEAKYKVTYSV